MSAARSHARNVCERASAAPVYAVKRLHCPSFGRACFSVAARLLILLPMHVPRVCRRDMLNSQEEIDEN